MANLPSQNKQAQTTFSQVTAFIKEGNSIRLSRKELAISCLLLNSADYCIDTISALEEKLVEKASGEFKAQIGNLVSIFFNFIIAAKTQNKLFFLYF